MTQYVPTWEGVRGIEFDMMTELVKRGYIESRKAVGVKRKEAAKEFDRWFRDIHGKKGEWWYVRDTDSKEIYGWFDTNYCAEVFKKAIEITHIYNYGGDTEVGVFGEGNND